MITYPLTPGAFLEKFRHGQLGDKEITISKETVTEGELIVFFSIYEQYWPYPFVFESHHVYPLRTVILQGRVTQVKNDKFDCELLENNGFAQKEGVVGKTLTIPKGQLLCEQNYTSIEKLGIWDREKTFMPEHFPWEPASVTT